MTIDEAIKEFTEWARDNRKEQNFWTAERDENGETIPFIHADCDGLARAAEVRAEYNEQLAEWLTELKEAKRLLKAAIEDLNATAAEVYNGGVICECCKWESQIGKCSCPDDGGCDTDYQWRYADEALKLIGDEPNK